MEIDPFIVECQGFGRSFWNKVYERVVYGTMVLVAWSNQDCMSSWSSVISMHTPTFSLTKSFNILIMVVLCFRNFIGASFYHHTRTWYTIFIIFVCSFQILLEFVTRLFSFFFVVLKSLDVVRKLTENSCFVLVNIGIKFPSAKLQGGYSNTTWPYIIVGLCPHFQIIELYGVGLLHNHQT